MLGSSNARECTQLPPSFSLPLSPARARMVNSEKRVCISWPNRAGPESLEIYIDLCQRYQARQRERERKRERVSVSETSVWSPLTASRSSIYYKDRAASRGRIIDKARRPTSTAWTAADIIPQAPTISFISFRNRSPRHFLFNGNHYRARGNCSNDRVDTFFSPLPPKKSRRRDSRYVRFQNFEINKFIY